MWEQRAVEALTGTHFFSEETQTLFEEMSRREPHRGPGSRRVEFVREKAISSLRVGLSRDEVRARLRGTSRDGRDSMVHTP
jgi:hypothetical protein